MDDVRKTIYGTLILFVAVIGSWIGFLFAVGCSGSLECAQGKATPERTSIPSLVPATLPPPQLVSSKHTLAGKCQVGALDLLAAWDGAAYPQTASFDFTDVHGTTCTATFEADVQPLFDELNIWYAGAQACDTCHKADLAKGAAGLDLSSYDGIVMGSHRTNANAPGQHILGGGVWEQSVLYKTLVLKNPFALGHPIDSSKSGPLVYAGKPKAPSTPTPAATSTATPAPSQ